MFWWGHNPWWVIMTLRTVTRDNKNLQQLILETFYDPVDQAPTIRSAFLVDVVFRAGSEPPAICFVFVSTPFTECFVYVLTLLLALFTYLLCTPPLYWWQQGDFPFA